MSSIGSYSISPVINNRQNISACGVGCIDSAEQFVVSTFTSGDPNTIGLAIQATLTPPLSSALPGNIKRVTHWVDATTTSNTGYTIDSAQTLTLKSETNLIQVAGVSAGSCNLDLQTNKIINAGQITSSSFVGPLSGNSTTATTASACSGNSATATTATTALACSGNSVTATTASACSGNSATATTASACSGNSVTATTATTALACSGNSATATTASACSGNSATATTASACSGNSVTATTANTSLACSGNSATATTASACSGNSATSTVSSTVALTSDNSATTCYIPFSKTIAGNDALFIDDTTGPLTYIPSTSTLSASVFAGALTGNSSTSTLATSSTNIVNAGLTANQNYPIAYLSANTSGANVQVSSDTVGNHLLFNPSLNQLSIAGNVNITGSASVLSIGATGTAISCASASAISFPLANVTATTFTGTLSGTATNATNVQTTTSAANTNYTLMLVPSTSTSLQSPIITNSLLYNPSTANLQTTTFTGALVGNASSATTSVNATNATKILTAAVSNNQNYVVPFYASNVASNQSVLNDTQLQYNPSTSTLFATNFQGLASTSTLATTATTATTATNVSTTATVGNQQYALFMGPSTTTGSQATQVTSSLLYNASTQTLAATNISSTGISATTFTGALVGNASSSTVSTTVALTSDNSATACYIPFSKTVAGNDALFIDDVTGPLQYTPSTSTLSCIAISAKEYITILQTLVNATTVDLTLGTLLVDTGTTALTFTLPILTASSNGLSIKVQKTSATNHNVVVTAGIGNTVTSLTNVPGATYTLTNTIYEQSFTFINLVWYPF